jgi:phthalate 4,5-dioxygenase
MLSKADNERLTRVGPGTTMGNLLRRFWLPFLLPEELAEADAPPMKVRLMGEDLLAFRDTNGRLGLLERYCPHRRVDLFLGRNEECGLRCINHGWKFDVGGNVVDMPSEPEESALRRIAKARSYPIVEWGGVIWAYLGDPAQAPAVPPQFEWGRVSAEHRFVTKRLQENNYAQSVEGGIDSSHVGILHGLLDPDTTRPFRERLRSIVPTATVAKDLAPRFEVRPTPYGMLIGARRVAGDDYYWRITQFLMPFYTMFAPGEKGGNIQGHAWTPIDDYNTWTFSMTWNPGRPLNDKDRAFGTVHTPLIPDGSYRGVHNQDNMYGLDRDVQRRLSVSGMQDIGTQDSAVQESMGAIVDRSTETLGMCDTAIAAYRKMLLAAARALESGTEPESPLHPEWYRVRSAAIVLPKEIDFQEGASSKLQSETVYT